MTIKLSTTNSVNKTLQHKALWDLILGRGCSSEGVSPLGHRSSLGTPEMGRLFLREIHMILCQFRRTATWGVENTTICPALETNSPSQGPKRRDLMLGAARCGPRSLWEMWRGNKRRKLPGVSSTEDDEVKTTKQEEKNRN